MQPSSLTSRDHGLPIYDGLIVATALEADCNRLLTEDLQAGQNFSPFVVTNLFA